MNDQGLLSTLLNLLFYIFIMLLIAFVISKNFRKCVLRTFLPESWVKKLGYLFSQYIFACDTTDVNTPKTTTATAASTEKFTSNKQIVLTAYTADWCPHCVTFKNESYGKLKNHFSNNSNIKINNVDCTNDSGGNTKTMGGKSLQGFPTLVVNVVVDGKSTKEEMYEGSRDAKSIISFLENM